MYPTKKTCMIYKGDLKFTNIENINKNEFETEFETEQVREIYNNYKSKPKIEMRIKYCEMENYEYLDLSKLELDNNLLEDLFKLQKIIKILGSIKFLDLSNNILTKYPDLSSYPNIQYLSIGYNNISGEIIDNDRIELSCEYNKITLIKSKSLNKLSASNNLIIYIDVPNINFMVINENKIDYIPSYSNLEYLECINNELVSINNMEKLEELYIAYNKLVELSNMPKLKILNCTYNPINKINYIPSLTLIICSTPKISSKFVVTNTTKIKKDYLIYLENKT